MKILWVTNTIFPELSKAIGRNAPVVGGWMYGLANGLVNANVDLVVATSRPNVEAFETTINGTTYYLLSGKEKATEFDVSLNPQWKKLISKVNPDAVHIHGTEYAHGLSLMKACPNLNYVISIQGLVSICARYFTGGIPYLTIKKNRTIRDFIKNDGILKSQKEFFKRGELVEKEYFKIGRNFIGRTSWDFDHTRILNPKATYHFCNESLRDVFYDSKKWSTNSMKKHTIFVSQAIYPIKGLHQILKAIALIKDEFPDLKIKIAGGNVTRVSSLRDRLALGGYGKYLISLIQKYQLKDHIEFTGVLDKNQMVQEYLNCNVFICPSSIENSANSIGEAQLLGVPCIASYVGGAHDLIEHKKTGILYRFEEVEMMAQSIKEIFNTKTLMEELSTGGIKVASERHNRDTNLKTTLEIYKKIISE